MGLCDKQDFDVEVLLPNGRQYALERSEHPERETRPRKEHDKTRRVRFHLNIPPGIGARNAIERAAAMSRLHGHLRRHFKGHGAHNIGFFKARDEHTGRAAHTLTGFVNHPETVTRKQFITAAFKDIQYFNAAMGELAKVILSRDEPERSEQTSINAAFAPSAPSKQPGGRCNVFILWR